jgi:site-specific DNA-adenine methylase
MAPVEVVGPIVAEHLQYRQTLIVPFAGSMTMLEWLAENGHLENKKVIVNDINSHLINAWKCVDDSEKTRKLFDSLQLYTRIWNRKHEKGYWASECHPKTGKQRNMYRAPECEAMFERMKTKLARPIEDEVLSATLFLLFNRLCFNGLWRMNKSGSLVTPIGRTGKRDYLTLPDWRKVIGVGSWVRNLDIEFNAFDWAWFMAGSALEDSVIYAHPPHYSKYNQYTTSGFAQGPLLDYLTKRKFVKGVTCVLSNSIECKPELNPFWQITEVQNKKDTEIVGVLV